MYCFTYFNFKYILELIWVSQINWAYLYQPSTRDVSNVTLAALRRPAGRFSPIFSSFSRSRRPPFLLFALNKYEIKSILNKFSKVRLGSKVQCRYDWAMTYRLSTPPNNDAFKHSGGESRRCTSAIVTLYLEVLDSRLSRPGTEQKTSLGDVIPRPPCSFPLFIARNW